MTHVAVLAPTYFARHARVVAIGCAAAVHGVLAALLIWLTQTPVRPASQQPNTVSVVFAASVVVPPDPDPATPAVDAQPPNAAAPVSMAPTGAPDGSPEPAGPGPGRSTAPPPTGSALATERVNLDADTPPPEGAFATPSARALRGLVCARGLGRDGVDLCSEGEAIDLLAYAGDGAVEAVDGFARSRFAAMDWGVVFTGEGRFAGAAGTLTLAPRASNLTASDEMRDRLPPLAPDPAFGD